MDERETLLGISSIYLFGRQLEDIQIKGKYEEGFGGPVLGANQYLRAQFMAEGARLARIFAFSFEGCLFELGRPTIFLVHGLGMKIDEPAPNDKDGNVVYGRLVRSPGSSAVTGLGRQTGGFAKDLRVWIYDKADFSMRLDAETGTLEQILLAAELDDEMWSSEGRSGSGRSGSGRSGSGRSGSGRSGSGRSGSGRSGS